MGQLLSVAAADDPANTAAPPRYSETAAADPSIPPWATPAVPRDHDIFVSFQSDDSAEIIRNVTATFEPLGLKVFNPVHGLDDPSSKDMQQHITRSHVMIAAISPKYFESKWCCIEARAAMEANVPIIPVYDGTKYVYAHGPPTNMNPMFWKGEHPQYHPFARGEDGTALRNYVFRRNLLPATSDNDQAKATSDLIAAVSSRIRALGEKLSPVDFALMPSEVVVLDSPPASDESEDDGSGFLALAPPKDADGDACLELDLRAVEWDWQAYVQRRGQWINDDILGKLLSYGQRRSYSGICSAVPATSSTPGTEYALAVFNCDIDFRPDLSIREHGIVRRIIDRLKKNLAKEIDNEKDLDLIVVCTGWVGCVELVLKAPTTVFAAIHRILSQSALTAPAVSKGLKVDEGTRLISLEPIFVVTSAFEVVRPLLSQIAQLDSDVDEQKNVCALVRLPLLRLLVPATTLQQFSVYLRQTSTETTEKTGANSGEQTERSRSEHSDAGEPSISQDATHGLRTVSANTPEAVHEVLQRLGRNDPECTSIALILAPPYLKIAESLAVAIKDNTVLTSLKLELAPGGDVDEILSEGGPIDFALKTNGYLTIVEVTGAVVPSQWRTYLRRNSSLQIPAPEPLQQSNTDREQVDLATVPWAFEEDDRLLNLRSRDSIGIGVMGITYKINIDGVTAVAQIPNGLFNPELYLGDVHADAVQTMLQQCIRELSALQRLKGHPNIVEFRCVFYTSIQGVLFPKWICTDFVEGSLSTRIARGEVDFLPDVIGIVSGLEFIHNQGMTHRGIKPQSILVGPDSTMQLADMGFVRISSAMLDFTSKEPLRRMSQLMYLAPDVIEGAENDPGRDVYAFGVTTVEMILKEVPAHKHEGRMEQVRRAMTVTPEFAYLFRRCCEPCSVDRPSCRGLLVALNAQAIAAHATRFAEVEDQLAALSTSTAREADMLRSELAEYVQRASQEAYEASMQSERSESIHREEVTKLLRELEDVTKIAQDAQQVNAELTQRLSLAEGRIPGAVEASRFAAASSLPSACTPDDLARDVLDAAMRILNHGVGPYPPCEEAVRLLRNAAAFGNPDALCELGVCLDRGRGVHINVAEAKELLREAVAKGSVEAPGHLARIDTDYRRTAPSAIIHAAVARWRERARQGHADAQECLGRCYFVGIGVVKDIVEAARWFQLSADQGCAAGQCMLGACYGTGTGVLEDSRKAVQLYQLAADQGDAIAQSNLGNCHEHGLDVPKDQVEAFNLDRLSAEQGFSFGQYHLGRCYIEGIGVKKDLVEARRWLTLSANQGNSLARDLLAQLS